ncbi:helicase [Bifidobacterium sp. UTCIF-37]|uniref:DEAD/DEAH box helicase n=1 Tax=unclassified Bifidobacterium TaxID=2608897 RepID=UPI00112638CD|nr:MULTISPECIES: DEAD/DEAH box helicase [unclassified Bifidobacterium]TPF86253.1 helicase [Bifidobacterium sp. UTCIF-37]TPF88603.1 helicase [Bifidobacterium sp. UTCIF-38]
MGLSVFGRVSGSPDGFDDGDPAMSGPSFEAPRGGAVGLPLYTSLRHDTSPAVLARARSIADYAVSMMDSLDYTLDARTGSATITGRIRGTSSPSSRYTVNVYFNTDTGEISGGGCTCPAYARGYDICKHMAALVIAFINDPDRFDGFGAPQSISSSRRLLAAMQQLDEQDDQARRARRRESMINAGTSDGRGRASQPKVVPGSVMLAPILSYLDGRWSVEFRIGVEGAMYVLKSISTLLDDMRLSSYRAYGQKLAFTHTPAMLDSRSRAMLGFLNRIEDVRRAVDLQDVRYGALGSVRIDRHLPLAESETARLLDIVAAAPDAAGSDNTRIGLVLDEWFNRSPVYVPVNGEGPDAMPVVSMTRLNGDGGVDGYALHGRPPIETTIAGDDGVWLLMPPADAHGRRALRNTMLTSRAHSTMRISAVGYRFVRCPKPLERFADLLPVVCGEDPNGEIVAFDDAPLFARTLMPCLVDAGLMSAGDVPREIELLRPVECEPEFYLDRDDKGITCVAKARYGDRETTIVPQHGGDFIAGATPMVGAGHDFAAERAMLDLVRTYFEIPSPADPAFIGRDETMRIIALFDEGLPALRAMGRVFTTPAFDRLLAPKPPSVTVGLAIRSNLVEISPIADEVPPDEVGALLASYRRRQRFHRLKDGTFVDLRGAKLDALDRVAADLDLDESELDDGPVTLPGMQAFLLDGELAGEGVRKEPSFMRYVDELKTIDPTRYAVPDELAHVLRPYQVEGFRWLRTLYDKGFGGILADEMGLGKSVQLIALLLSLSDVHADTAAADTASDASDAAKPAPSLIVCPASLVYNWVAEFSKFAPGVDVVAVAGTKAERRDAIARCVGRDVVLITSYDLLRRDVDDYGDVRFDVMALDEAQVIKNHTTKIAKAVKAIDAEHRFALTGTPIENRLSELWSIFDFLMPGLLGSYRRFHERYELPISNARAADRSTAEGRAAAEVNPEGERVAHRLQALVGVFIKRRLKAQVLTDLPDKIETTVTVQLEGEQRRLYAAHEQRLRQQLEHSADADFNTSKIQILAELMKLRQICCDPRLLYANAKDHSAKLAAIEELISSCMSEGKKALVFSQFTSFLDLIAARLDRDDVAYYTITGSTPKRRRLELVDRFNADDTPVFLISLKAGNTGLNLVGASVVIHADPWWNAAAQDQATDRAHRIGQRRDVDVYRIVAKDTIEERILELQHSKSELARRFTDAEALAAAAPATISTLSRDDLLGLLG